MMRDLKKHHQIENPTEIKWLHKNGETIVTEQVNVPIYDEEGKLVAIEGIVRNVTDRIRVDEALKESENRYRSLFEDSPISLWEKDFSEVKRNIDKLRESGVKDFVEYFDDHPEAVVRLANFVKVVSVNNATLKLFKVRNKHEISSDLGEVFDTEEYEAFKRILIALATGKKSFETETTTQTSTGDKICVTVRISAAPGHEKKLDKVFASMIDVTEEKKMEEAMRNSEEFFRSVIENSHDGTAIIDSDFRTVYANNELCSILGYSKDEIVGQDFRRFVDKDSRDLVQARFVCILRGQDAPSQYVFKIRHKNGERKDVEIKSSHIRDKHGKTSLIAQLLEVSEREKMEDERKRFEERLSALNTYGQSLNMARSMDEIYKLTLDATEKTLGFEIASILIIEGRMLRLVAQRGYSRDLSLQLPLDGDKGITVRSARKGKPIYVPDVRKDKTFSGAPIEAPEDEHDRRPSKTSRNGVLSELAMPIKAGSKVLGVLNVERKKLTAFNDEDRKLLEILASHAAIAMSNLRRQDQLIELTKKLSYLMRNTTEIMHTKEMYQRLKAITKAIRRFGWRRVVISLRNEDLEGTKTVTIGLTREENRLLMQRKASGQVWRERLGSKFEKYKVGEFYYLPWNNPWVRENVHGVSPEAPLDNSTTYAGVPSKLSPQQMVDWHPQDMLYAPLRTPERRIVGILSMDDPVDGRRPNRESLAPLELFLHEAAIIIENAQLVESLNDAREQLESYAGQLEQKVEERTRELRVSQGQLLKAQRLAVIGELAGMVGHDLRNPLTSIAGATYYVRKRMRTQENGKIGEMLEMIEKNIDYSNKIINDLLDYSREIRLDLMDINPQSIIKESLTVVEIPKSIQLIDLTQNKPKIRIDAGKMKRAFVNIIKNAVDAMPNGGELTIDCEKSNDGLKFTFSDTGVGMTKDTIEKLWTPLFTTKAKGMGFGLPICKRVIEAHGGFISVRSAINKGATFEVTLPIQPKTEEGGEEIWVKKPESSLLTTTKT
jgi:PAS domain S-box-containing protein